MTEQVVKEVELLSDQCAKMLAKANELVRRAPDPQKKDSTDKETAELRTQT